MVMVIDTSVIIAVVMNEEGKKAAIDATIDTPLVAPGSLPWEVGNALSSLMKRSRIDLDQALEGIKAFQEIPLRLVDVDLENVLHLSKELNIYAYDAYVLACAAMLNAPLLTFDNTMKRLAEAKGIDLVEVNGNA